MNKYKGVNKGEIVICKNTHVGWEWIENEFVEGMPYIIMRINDVGTITICGETQYYGMNFSEDDFNYTFYTIEEWRSIREPLFDGKPGDEYIKYREEMDSKKLKEKRDQKLKEILK